MRLNKELRFYFYAFCMMLSHVTVLVPCCDVSVSLDLLPTFGEFERELHEKVAQQNNTKSKKCVTHERIKALLKFETEAFEHVNKFITETIESERRSWNWCFDRGEGKPRHLISSEDDYAKCVQHMQAVAEGKKGKKEKEPEVPEVQSVIRRLTKELDDTKKLLSAKDEKIASLKAIAQLLEKDLQDMKKETKATGIASAGAGAGAGAVFKVQEGTSVLVHVKNQSTFGKVVKVFSSSGQKHYQVCLNRCKETVVVEESSIDGVCRSGVTMQCDALFTKS
jgi:hypothetical protein